MKEESKMVVKVWYVEPLGSYTNNHIAVLVAQGIEESICQGKRCADGAARNLIQLTVSQLEQCIVSKKASKLTFRIFADAGQGIVPVIESDEIDTVFFNDQAPITLDQIEQLRRITTSMHKIFPPGVLPYNATKMRQREFVLTTPVRARK